MHQTQMHLKCEPSESLLRTAHSRYTGMPLDFNEAMSNRLFCRLIKLRALSMMKRRECRD